MSIVFPIGHISEKILKTKFTTKAKWSLSNQRPKLIDVYYEDKENGELHVPMGCYRRMCPKNGDRDNFPYSFEDYSTMDLPFVESLLTVETDYSGRKRDQDVLIDEVLLSLHRRHTALVAAHTGFGKTATAIWLMSYLGLKVVLLCHNITVRKQWIDEIMRFTGGKAKIQYLEGKAKIDPNADIYLVGILKSTKYHPDDFIDIGTVIVDEAHQCTEKAFTHALLLFRPYYLIGLSATPDRTDGLDNLFRFYFGEPSNYIYRHEVKKFIVLKYQTQYAFPEIRYTSFNGKRMLAWSSMITDLTNIEERWKEIGDIALHHPKEKIMIMCDRKEMARYIHRYLLEKGDSASLFIDGVRKCDKTKRVMVAGIKKGGVGMNDPDLTMAIIAADSQDVRQPEGRIRKVNCIIYTIVDDHPRLETHWKEQEKWYNTRGATIRVVSHFSEVDEILVEEGIRE